MPHRIHIHLSYPQFLKFYDSAKLPINSTYNVDEQSGTEERAIFCAHFYQNINITKKKEAKVTVNIISKEKFGAIVLITNV